LVESQIDGLGNCKNKLKLESKMGTTKTNKIQLKEIEIGQCCVKINYEGKHLNKS
jgi:hypothetical protein